MVRSTRSKRTVPVHFLFGSHGPRDRARLWEKAGEVRSLLYEYNRGETPSDYSRFKRMILGMTQEQIRTHAQKMGKNEQHREQIESVMKSIKQGKEAMAGEMARGFMGRIRLYRLNFLESKREKLFYEAYFNPTLENIRKYYVASGTAFGIRHALIKKNVGWLLKNGLTPIAGEYGTAHSLLSREFQDLGLEISREVKRTVFDHDIELIRMLIRGKKPRTIPPKMFKSAFVSRILRANIEDKWNELSQDSEIGSRTLLTRLSEAQLDSCLNKIRNDRHGLIPLVLEFNSLPNNISGDGLLKFVMAKKPMYKRFLSER